MMTEAVQNENNVQTDILLESRFYNFIHFEACLSNIKVERRLY